MRCSHAPCCGVAVLCGATLTRCCVFESAGMAAGAPSLRVSCAVHGCWVSIAGLCAITLQVGVPLRSMYSCKTQWVGMVCWCKAASCWVCSFAYIDTRCSQPLVGKGDSQLQFCMHSLTKLMSGYSGCGRTSVHVQQTLHILPYLYSCWNAVRRCSLNSCSTCAAFTSKLCGMQLMQQYSHHLLPAGQHNAVRLVPCFAAGEFFLQSSPRG